MPNLALVIIPILIIAAIVGLALLGRRKLQDASPAPGPAPAPAPAPGPAPPLDDFNTDPAPATITITASARPAGCPGNGSALFLAGCCDNSDCGSGHCNNDMFSSTGKSCGL